MALHGPIDHPRAHRLASVALPTPLPVARKLAANGAVGNYKSSFILFVFNAFLSNFDWQARPYYVSENIPTCSIVLFTQLLSGQIRLGGEMGGGGVEGYCGVEGRENGVEGYYPLCVHLRILPHRYRAVSLLLFHSKRPKIIFLSFFGSGFESYSEPQTHTQGKHFCSETDAPSHPRAFRCDRGDN